ncbi:hypothetical protein Cflav_PD2183 [Pedosphaera parvula Ellin514]|uniref:Uncharacterized protein n=1 Tax=Pedosphaera parvula (strain Ellin514) TaxID=320771 RepID=B9XM63_PEDPL|nr:hypothetical protein Cflav_PD2183 [Pedosphaera parvula Ellin514]
MVEFSRIAGYQDVRIGAQSVRLLNIGGVVRAAFLLRIKEVKEVKSEKAGACVPQRKSGTGVPLLNRNLLYLGKLLSKYRPSALRLVLDALRKPSFRWWSVRLTLFRRSLQFLI